MKVRNKFKFGQSSNKKKHTVSNYLQLAANRALQCSPIDFGVPWRGGRRLAHEQYDLFEEGHSKCDGYKKKSYHQQLDKDGLGMALDLVPYIVNVGYSYESFGRFGIIGMLMLEAWEELQDEGLIPTNLYLHWGGLWSHKDPLKIGWDMAHYEIRDYEQVEKV